jgi:uncharacterized protein
MNTLPNSYLSPKCEARHIADFDMNGVFACKPIKKGELIAVFGGIVCDDKAFQEMPPVNRMLSIQVEENLYLVPDHIGQGDYFNHSCNPNAGLLGQITLVAMRDIKPGEQVRFDYAMSDCNSYDEFDCNCGEPNCRGRVTGDDWQNREIQDRYAGFFAPHIERRIKKLRAQQRKALYSATYGAVTNPPLYE